MAIFPESRNGGIYHSALESPQTGKGVSVGECGAGSGVRVGSQGPGHKGAPGKLGGVPLSEQEVALQALGRNKKGKFLHS